jgi:hypothetical protein
MSDILYVCAQYRPHKSLEVLVSWVLGLGRQEETQRTKTKTKIFRRASHRAEVLISFDFSCSGASSRSCIQSKDYSADANEAINHLSYPETPNVKTELFPKERKTPQIVSLPNRRSVATNCKSISISAFASVPHSRVLASLCPKSSLLYDHLSHQIRFRIALLIPRRCT